MRAKTSKPAEVTAAVNRSIVSRTLNLLAMVIRPLPLMCFLLLISKEALLLEYHIFDQRGGTMDDSGDDKVADYYSLRSFQMFSIGQRRAQAVSAASRYVLVASLDGCVSIRSSTTKPARRKSRIHSP